MAGVSRGTAIWVVVGLIALAIASCVACRVAPKVTELVVQGESRDLRERDSPVEAGHRPRLRLLVIGIDGIDRDLLYRMLRQGELPGLAALLGGRRGGQLPHAHLSDRVLSTMPSSTAPAWASIFTGAPPAEHGVTGNEYFIRSSRTLAAPIPVSFEDLAPVVAIYTDDEADEQLQVPTIYQRMRQEEPGLLIWVSMSQFHAGADRLLLAKRAVLAKAAQAFLERVVGREDHREVYEDLDEEVMEVVFEEIADEAPPDVLTIYLSGADLYAHQAPTGPERSRVEYLREVLDPELRTLYHKLDERGALDDAYVVVVSDHGHTQVMADDRHALDTDGPAEPPKVLEAAGFRVRPFQLEVPDEEDDFQAVMAYGGATAFVYLADRSRCPRPGQRCDFDAPARWREDVLATAEAFHRSSTAGDPVPGMKDTLELVLVRRPVAVGETPRPFEVYLGGGRTRPLGEHLAAHPELPYVDAEARLRDLAVGPAGDRAGDILLLARSAAADRPEDRFYFSSTYHSWHGSPSRRDSEVPLIVAHRRRSAEQLRRITGDALGEHGRLQAVGQLLVNLARR